VDNSRSMVEVTLRIPGKWQGPQDLLARVPDGCRISGQHLILPGGAKIEIHPRPPDDQFSHVFRTSSRLPPSPRELEIVNSYDVNVCLTGAGGSMDAARTMMDAGAAIVRAGAGGVFIDNCGLAHGASQWIEMADDGSPDALSFAFVAIVRGKQEVWTSGMHILGLPELLMSRSDADADEQAIVETIRYVCSSENPVEVGHLLADDNGPRYQVRSAGSDKFAPGNPMHNPFGRLKLVRFRDIAEQN